VKGEEHGEPLVVEVIAKVELVVEVGEIGGAEVGGFGLGRERRARATRYSLRYRAREIVGFGGGGIGKRRAQEG
jgi:hypothetical protein